MIQRRTLLAVLAASALAGAVLAAAPVGAASSSAKPAPSGCALNSANGDIKHVIYLQFDNTHFLRDNPNVPSDLEQMPHLLNFLRGNGTLFCAKPERDAYLVVARLAFGVPAASAATY